MDRLALQLSVKKKRVTCLIGTREVEGGFVFRYALTIPGKSFDGPTGGCAVFHNEAEAVEMAAKILYGVLMSAEGEQRARDTLKQIQAVRDVLAEKISDFAGFLTGLEKPDKPE
jgi:hypothetical protein